MVSQKCSVAVKTWVPNDGMLVAVSVIRKVPTGLGADGVRVTSEISVPLLTEAVTPAGRSLATILTLSWKFGLRTRVKVGEVWSKLPAPIIVEPVVFRASIV